MRENSLTGLADLYSRALNRRLLFIVIPLFAILGCTILIVSKLTLLNQAFESVHQQLSHSILVGDGFQIQRILSSQIRSGALSGVTVVAGKDRDLIFAEGRRRRDPFEWSLSALTYTKTFDINGPKSTSIGIAAFSVDIKNLTFIILIAAAGIAVAIISFLARLALKSFARSLISPMEELAHIVTSGATEFSSEVTEINRLFGALAAARSMERANWELIENSRKSEALIALSKRVAHDVRSPLSAMRMAVAVLQDSNSSEAFEVLQAAVKRVDNIAEDLLSAGRSATSGAFDLTCLLRELVEAIAIQSPVRINLKADMPMYHVGKRVSVSRALANYLQNAVEACDPTVGVVGVEVRSLNGGAEIVISDNGRGMSSTDLLAVQIFEGFSKGKENGNGLGVSSASKVIRESGGSVVLSSDLGLGTTVTMILPIVYYGAGITSKNRDANFQAIHRV